jgi:protease-4
MHWKKDKIAVVYYGGTIFRRNIEDYLSLFRTLEKDSSIKGVLLEIESPGGSATDSEYLYRKLARLRDKKPLYCYALMAASGGYMAAAAAKKIYVPSTAIVGSIGVLSVKPVLRELLERIGIGVEVMKKGNMKDMTMFHRESTEDERRSMSDLHEDIYDQFISLVAGERGLEQGKVRELATGEIFSGLKAVELGLADVVSDIDTAIDDLGQEVGVPPGREVYLKPRRQFLRKFMRRSASVLADELYWRASVG